MQSLPKCGCRIGASLQIWLGWPATGGGELPRTQAHMRRMCRVAVAFKLEHRRLWRCAECPASKA
eukprot:4016542-Pleurochrysis_carterae.AAC.1